MKKLLLFLSFIPLTLMSMVTPTQPVETSNVSTYYYENEGIESYAIGSISNVTVTPYVNSAVITYDYIKGTDPDEAIKYRYYTTSPSGATIYSTQQTTSGSYEIVIENISPNTNYTFQIWINEPSTGTDTTPVSSTFTTLLTASTFVITVDESNITSVNQEPVVEFDYTLTLNQGRGDIDYRLIKDVNDDAAYNPADGDVNVTLNPDSNGRGEMTQVDGNEGPNTVTTIDLGYTGSNALEWDTNYYIEFWIDGKSMLFGTDFYIRPMENSDFTMTVDSIDSVNGNPVVTFDYSLVLNEGLGDIDYSIYKDTNGDNVGQVGENITINQDLNGRNEMTNIDGVEDTGTVTSTDLGYNLEWGTDYIIDFWTDDVARPDLQLLFSIPDKIETEFILTADENNVTSVNGEPVITFNYEMTINDGIGDIDYKLYEDTDTDGVADSSENITIGPVDSNGRNEMTAVDGDEGTGSVSTQTLGYTGANALNWDSDYIVEIWCDDVKKTNVEFTIRARNDSTFTLTPSSTITSSGGNPVVTFNYSLTINEGLGDVDYKLYEDRNNNNVGDSSEDVTINATDNGWNEMSQIDGNQGSGTISTYDLGYTGANALEWDSNYIVELKVDDKPINQVEFSIRTKVNSEFELTIGETTSQDGEPVVNYTWVSALNDGIGDIDYSLYQDEDGDNVADFNENVTLDNDGVSDGKNEMTNVDGTSTNGSGNSASLGYVGNNALEWNSTYIVQFWVDDTLRTDLTTIFTIESQNPSTFVFETGEPYSTNGDVNFLIEYNLVINDGQGDIDYAIYENNDGVETIGPSDINVTVDPNGYKTDVGELSTVDGVGGSGEVTIQELGYKDEDALEWEQEYTFLIWIDDNSHDIDTAINAGNDVPVSIGAQPQSSGSMMLWIIIGASIGLVIIIAILAYLYYKKRQKAAYLASPAGLATKTLEEQLLIRQKMLDEYKHLKTNEHYRNNWKK